MHSYLEACIWQYVSNQCLSVSLQLYIYPMHYSAKQIIFVKDRCIKNFICLLDQHDMGYSSQPGAGGGRKGNAISFNVYVYRCPQEGTLNRTHRFRFTIFLRVNFCLFSYLLVQTYVWFSKDCFVYIADAIKWWCGFHSMCGSAPQSTCGRPGDSATH